MPSTRSKTMRKSLIACLAVVLVLAGGSIALMRPRSGRINPAAAGRIKEGMTQPEVHALMCGPPGDRRTPSAPITIGGRNESGVRRTIEFWEGDYGVAGVDYYPTTTGESDRVMNARFEDAVPISLAGLGLARWRLGKWWEEVLP
jgi:hypothetical protein